MGSNLTIAIWSRRYNCHLSQIWPVWHKTSENFHKYLLKMISTSFTPVTNNCLFFSLSYLHLTKLTLAMIDDRKGQPAWILYSLSLIFTLPSSTLTVIQTMIQWDIQKHVCLIVYHDTQIMVMITHVDVDTVIMWKCSRNNINHSSIQEFYRHWLIFIYNLYNPL